MAGSLVVLMGAGGCCRVYLCAGSGSCSFFLVVQASARFPNLPLVVGLWPTTSLRSAKGRAVVVVPVHGWVEVYSSAT